MQGGEAGDPRHDEPLERQDELAGLSAVLSSAVTGAGGVTVIEGPAGIGKTRLLASAAALADRAGMRVLSARGGALEREFPYGIAQQLFEPALLAAAAGERKRILQGAAGLSGAVFGVDSRPGRPNLAAGADASFRIQHGLYWLVANLADQRPLLLTIDDLHWADTQSLRWLVYLVRRITELPVALAVATRPDTGDLPARISTERDALVVRPGPLSVAGVSELVVRFLEKDADDDFVRACRVVTGGNPFLLSALLDELSQEGIEPVASQAARVRAVSPRTVSRSLLLRIARLPPDVRELARAAAVLGAGVDLRVAAALAGLEPAAASEAADVLAAAEILAPVRPLEFLHPILRATLYEELLPGERSGIHARAAWLLHEDRARPERVAVHLQAAEPAGREWVVDCLREAAREALGRGAPQAARNWLRRALAEPPDADERAAVLTELGSAEALAGDAEAEGRLREALSLSHEGRDYAQRTIPLARILITEGRAPEAIVLLRAARGQLGDADRELALSLEAQLVAAGHNNLSSYEELRAQFAEMMQTCRGETPAERLLLASLSPSALAIGERAAEVGDLAERALGGGRLLREAGSDAQPLYMAATALLGAGRLELAEECLGQALADARSSGSLAGYALASAAHALVRFDQGKLAEAEADANAALEAAGVHGFQLGSVALSVLIDVLIEQARLEEAEIAFASAELPEGAPDEVLAHRLLASRGKLRIARGALREGLSDLLACGRSWQLLDPGGAHIDWAPRAALTHAQLGDHEEARRVARRTVERAREFEAARPIGIALAAAGVVEGGEPGVMLLEEAAATLADSGALLEEARALIHLGSARRRLGRRPQAREALRLGLDLAGRCPAHALEVRARDELLLVGMRPRHAARTGIGALTARERRVATMVARGETNRGVAQALFVTQKTIENHLGHVYQKLGINSRVELAEALDR